MNFRFLDFDLDTDAVRLSRAGEDIAVEPQVFRLLQFLIENRERVLTKDEIFERVWDGRIVSDGTLTSRINAARRALGDDGKAQSVIKTFPRRGFRFVAELKDGEEDIAGESAPAAARPQSERPSIAVLPFTNLSGDPDQEYFSDGIAEDIMTTLSRIRWFRVVGRNSAFAFKGQSQDVHEVARVLDARYVLEGSVRRAGERVRITAQLVDADSGSQIWADRYDRELEDIFAVQDEITNTVVSAIEPELQVAERERANKKPPDSLDAWDHALRGWARAWEAGSHGDPVEMEIAREHFERAIELDPNLSRAYTGLALYEALSLVLGLAEDRDATTGTGIASGRRAIELDREDDMAHVSLGFVFLGSGQPERAIPVFEDAIALNRYSPWAHFLRGNALVSTGEVERGIPQIQHAIAISPREPFIGPAMAWIAQGHLIEEDFNKSVEWAEKSLRHPVTQFWGNIALIAAFGHLGRLDEAKAAIKELQRRRPGIDRAWIENAIYIPAPNFRKVLIEGLKLAGL